MSWIPTQTVLDALIAQAEALTLEGEADPFFEKVFASTFREFVDAAHKALSFKKRACAVFPDEEKYSPARRGRFLEQDKRQLFTFVLTDKSYGPGQKAMFGDGTFPGVVNVKDLFARNLVGPLPGVAGAVVTLVDGEPASIKELESGREGYVLQVSVTMGTERRPLPKGTLSTR